DAEADVVARVIDSIPVIAASGAAIRGRIGPGAAAGAFAVAVGRAERIMRRALVVVTRLVIILPPLPDVAVHVEQPEGVGRVAADPGGPRQVLAARRGPVRKRAIEVGLVARRRLAPPERRAGPGPARVFPFRLGGQAVEPAGVALLRQGRQA